MWRCGVVFLVALFVLACLGGASRADQPWEFTQDATQIPYVNLEPGYNPFRDDRISSQDEEGNEGGVVQLVPASELEQETIPHVDYDLFESLHGVDGVNGGEAGLRQERCEEAPEPTNRPFSRRVRARPQLYAAAEYLAWWSRGPRIPPLATTSATGTDAADAGVIGDASTTVLFGGEDMLNGGHPGGRVTFGGSMGDYGESAVEFVYLFLDGDSASFAGAATDFAILARPFFNVDTGEEDSQLTAFPGTAEGDLRIEATTNFQSIELLNRQSQWDTRHRQLQWLVGYRYAELDDEIGIESSALSLAGASMGTVLDLSDRFNTENAFHGAVLGFAARQRLKPGFEFDCTAKLALGATRRTALVSGDSTVTPASGTPTTSSGGLLTQASNLGDYAENEFATISEVGCRIHHHLRQSTTVTIGYSVIYWSDVWRAGEQIELGVNPTQIPPGTLVGEARPAFPFTTSSYWAHGLTVGLESRF